MPIADIAAEKAQAGDIDPDLYAQVGGAQPAARQPRQRPTAQRQPPRQPGSTPSLRAGIAQMDTDELRLAVDVGILIMLILIWARL